MRSLTCWQLALLLTTLTACSAPSAAEKRTKELETVASWVATAHMVGDAWLQNAVPAVYAQQTLHSTQQELHKETDAIAKVTSTQERSQVLAKLQRLEQTIGQMSTAVAQNNRPHLQQQLQQLTVQQQAIEPQS